MVDAISEFAPICPVEFVDNQVDGHTQAHDRERRNQKCIHQCEVGDRGHRILNDELVGDDREDSDERDVDAVRQRLVVHPEDRPGQHYEQR